ELSSFCQKASRRQWCPVRTLESEPALHGPETKRRRKPAAAERIQSPSVAQLRLRCEAANLAVPAQVRVHVSPEELQAT
ncbi:unnamed protein product, partial [Polarella glacialis]